MIPVQAVEDNDGHWYLIPNDKVEYFHELLEDLSEDTEERFSELFGEYATGGDLNLIQLYINPDDQ